MTIEINFTLDKSNAPYGYLETGLITISVKNHSKTTINVFETCLHFVDSKKIPKFKTKCNIKIRPNEVVKFSPITFTIGLWAKYWSNFFNVSISYRELNKKWSSLKKFVRQPDEYLLVKNARKRNEKIFISHSNKKRDKIIIKKLHDYLTKLGFIPYIAERNPRLGYNLWKKIKRKISSSDLFIALCTVDGAKSGDVREEIGLVTGLNKRIKIIPILENTVVAPGSLLGLEHVNLDRKKIDVDINAAVNYILETLKKDK